VATQTVSEGLEDAGGKTVQKVAEKVSAQDVEETAGKEVSKEMAQGVEKEGVPEGSLSQRRCSSREPPPN